MITIRQRPNARVIVTLDGYNEVYQMNISGTRTWTVSMVCCDGDTEQDLINRAMVALLRQRQPKRGYVRAAFDWLYPSDGSRVLASGMVQ